MHRYNDERDHLQRDDIGYHHHEWVPPSGGGSMDDLSRFPHDPRDERAFDRNEDSILGPRDIQPRPRLSRPNARGKWELLRSWTVDTTTIEEANTVEMRTGVGRETGTLSEIETETGSVTQTVQAIETGIVTVTETESTLTRLNQSFNHENELNRQILNNSDTIEFFRDRDGPDTQKERGKAVTSVTVGWVLPNKNEQSKTNVSTFFPPVDLCDRCVQFHTTAPVVFLF